jgi:DNA-binding transcriptional MerR regulator
MTDMGYRGPQACKIVGITYRQLDYWTRTGLVEPSLQPAQGSGTQRLYSFNDLLQLKMIKNLIDAGASLQKVREAIDYVKNYVDEDWSKVIVANEGGVYGLTSQAELFDVMRKGQGVLGAVADLGQLKKDLNGTLHELRPKAVPVEYVSNTEEKSTAKEG